MIPSRIPLAIRSIVLGGLFALVQFVQAQGFTGHYPGGAEGIKAATLPPPGIYLRDYNFFYWADKYKDGPSDFDLFAYINAPRVIWMTDFKILGANYGMDLLVPFYYSDVSVGSFSDDTFAMGDLQFEPLLLGWHFKQFDLSGGYAFWAPSGDANEDGTRPARLLGKGFWSHMLTAGGTWYPTEDKTWAVSLLNRYEIHMENEDFDVTPGDSYTLEMGVSKSLKPSIELGVVGYYQQQINNDSGSGVGRIGYDAGLHDRIFAAGPEINLFCSKLAISTSLRYLREFGASDHPEGNKVVLTLTKRF